MGFDAAILDVDGVLVHTATLHAAAWQAVLDEVLAEHGQPPCACDVLGTLDHRPHLDGLRDLLAERGVVLTQEELQHIAERKNTRFQQELVRRGVTVHDDAVRQVRLWRRHGLGIAFVSMSREAGRLLAAAGLDRLCDVSLDGGIGAQIGLRDKPELFREAARRLGVEPTRAFLVEDTESGVAAAVEEGFALVVGLARAAPEQPAHARALLESGADRVVQRLDELLEITETGTCRTTELPSALDPGEVDARLGHGEPWIFLSLEGVLAPYDDDPADTAIAPETLDLLRQLASRATVGVLSGRPSSEIARIVGVDGLWYLGEHGLEIDGPTGHHAVRISRRAHRSLARVARDLHDRLAGVEGVTVEEKRLSLTVHYRRAAPEAVGGILRAVRRAVGAQPGVFLRTGARAVDVLPDVAWDARAAVEHVAERLGGVRSDLLPVLVADGTREAGFRALKHRGLSVLVGTAPHPTSADLRIDHVEQVPRFLAQLVTWLDERASPRGWALRYHDYDPAKESLREALCTLGNGVFALRGAAEESTADGVHYPGTYLAGGYDRLATEIAGEVLVHEDLVNWPDPSGLSFRPEGGQWLSVDHMEVLEFLQELDLRRGLLRRSLRVRDRDGHVTSVVTRRLVSMADPHVAAFHVRLVPENWSGRLELRATLDGTVTNDGVARYRKLRGDHLVPETVGHDAVTTWLVARTRQSRIRMAQVARTRVFEAADGALARRVHQHEDRVDERIAVTVREGRGLAVEKVVAVHTSRDPATSEALQAAREHMRELGDFARLLADHERRWSHLWRRCDVRIGVPRRMDGSLPPSACDTPRNRPPAEGAEPHLSEVSCILRLHVFHLLQVASPHVADRDVGVPARGLHGEAYRGHVFWDELFIFPFLDHSLPELSRELLMYRYRRLPAARRIARAQGFEGACFPWQSGSDGREESAVMHLNPRSGRWLPDDTHLQRHINAAVVYNVWKYFETTGDQEMLSFYGVELVLEVARFWASMATWSEAHGRYRITGVVGPDEFHTRDPVTGEPGLADNAYTNIMASWTLRTAERVLDELGDERRREVLHDVGVSDHDRARWHEIAKGLRVPFLDDGIICQFDGYETLEELDWEGLGARHGNIGRLDRILEAEGDSVERYKASKQADVLMLFFLFSADELGEQLRFMGYEFPAAAIPANIAYYAERTSNGSTLSRVVHSWVLARSDRPRSWRILQEALRSDVADIQGGTTAEGIHLGAMAGTVDLVRRGYTGAVIREGVLWLEPNLPDEVESLSLRFRLRKAWLDVHVTHEQLEVAFLTGSAPSARVGFAGRVHEVKRGSRHRFPLGVEAVETPEDAGPGEAPVG